MSIGRGTRRAEGVRKQDDGRWLIEVTRSNRLGKRVRRRRVVEATSLSEAKAARALFVLDVEEELRTGPQAPPRPPETLDDFAERWLRRKAQKVRESTLEEYRRAVDHFLVPYMGRSPIRDLHRDQVAEFVSWLENQMLPDGRSRSDASLKSLYRVAGSLLRDAAAEAGIPDPTNRVQGPASRRKRTREQRTLTREERDRLVVAVQEDSPRWGALVYVMAHTGMRTGEIRALQWRDAILGDDGAIDVQRSMAREEVYATKTGAPRSLPLTPEMSRVLTEHRLRLAEAGLPVMGQALVFPSPRTGGAFSTTTVNSVLKRAAEGLGLELRVSAQVLRRTVNTLLVAQVSGEVVRDLLGHCSAEMTARYHHTPVEARRAALMALASGDVTPKV